MTTDFKKDRIAILDLLYAQDSKQGKLSGFNITFPDEKYFEAKNFLYNKKYIKNVPTDQQDFTSEFSLVEITQDGMEYYEEEIEKEKHSKEQNKLDNEARRKENIESIWKKGRVIVTVVGIVVTILISVFLKSGLETNENSIEGSVLNIGSNIENQSVYFAESLDPSYENLRNEDLQGLEGDVLIKKWFDLVNTGMWKNACSLFVQDKCDIRDGESINNHVNEARSKTVDGYHLESVTHASDAPDNVWCVRYSYQEKVSTVPRVITLIMQYTLVERSDGGQDIGIRLCEKKWAQGLGEKSCVSPSVYYCRD